MNIRELPLELKEVAREICNEDKNNGIDNVNCIINWLNQQQHINARMDAQWLIGFLRGCKHNLEKTKKKLDSYYTIRTHLPELFGIRDPLEPKINEMLHLGTYLPLPLVGKPDGRRVIFTRLLNYDPQKYTFLNICMVPFMILEILMMEDDRLNVIGMDVILDLTGSTLEHASQCTPAVIKKIMRCIQDAYPVKIKSLHYINTPPFFDAIFSIFKRFLSRKLRDRVIIHNTLEDLYKYIPQSLLPSDYGGDSLSVVALTKEWTDRVITKRDWFIKDAEYNVTELKRVGQPITNTDLFGVDGNFRQLELD